MTELKSQARAEVIGRVSATPELDRTSRGVRVCLFKVVTESGPASNPVVKDVYVIGRLGADQEDDLPVRCAQREVGDPVIVAGVERQRRRRRRGVSWVESAIEASEVRDWICESVGEPTVRHDGETKVVHCMRESYDVYIGRGKDPESGERGEWGNPFSDKPSDLATVTNANSVEEAIESYRRDLWKRIRAGEVSLEKLAALKGKTLGCWCAPGPCHGEVLAAAADWAAGERAKASRGAC